MNIKTETQLIYGKMSAVMRDIGSIGKDQKNVAQGFKFRGIDQFVNALYPALTRHNVFMAPRATRYEHQLCEVETNGVRKVDKHVSILMEYEFYAEDGSSVTIGPIPAEGLDRGDKATNKALSAALKYALIQTFSIPTEDMAEGDLDSPQIELAHPKRPTHTTVTHNSPALPSFTNDAREEEPSPPNDIFVPTADQRAHELQEMLSDPENTHPSRFAKYQATGKTVGTSEWGSYIVKFGKYKDKKLFQITFPDLRNYVGYLQKSANETGKPIGAMAKELINAAEQYLKAEGK